MTEEKIEDVKENYEWWKSNVPKCNKEILIPLHKNKKDNNDFICQNCKVAYRTINILTKLLNSNK